MSYHTITRIDEAQVHYDHHTGWSVSLHIAQDPIGNVVEFDFDTFSLASYLYDLTDEDWYINYHTLPADHSPFDGPLPSVMGWQI